MANYLIAMAAVSLPHLNGCFLDENWNPRYISQETFFKPKSWCQRWEMKTWFNSYMHRIAMGMTFVRIYLSISRNAFVLILQNKQTLPKSDETRQAYKSY